MRLFTAHRFAEEYGWSWKEIEETPVSVLENLSFLQNEIERQHNRKGGERKLKKALRK